MRLLRGKMANAVRGTRGQQDNSSRAIAAYNSSSSMATDPADVRASCTLRERDYAHHFSRNSNRYRRVLCMSDPVIILAPPTHSHRSFVRCSASIRKCTACRR